MRNANVELFRFFASVCIALYHFEWICLNTSVFIPYFFIWVEFFFIVSGFFLAGNIEKKQVENTGGGCKCIDGIQYTYSQGKKLYPLYLLAFLFSFCIYYIVNPIERSQILKGIWLAKWELLLSSILGFDNSAPIYNRGGAVAYIGAMLIGSMTLYYFIDKHKYFFYQFLGLAMIILFYGRIINVAGNLSQWATYDSVINLGILRGIAGMSVGALTWHFINPVMAKSKKARIFSNIVFWVFIAILINPNTQIINQNDMIFCVFVFAVQISTLYNMKSDFLPKTLKRIFLRLGKMSYPIFLFHYGVLILLKHYWKKMNYGVAVVFVLFMLIFGYGISKIMEYFSSGRRNV